MYSLIVLMRLPDENEQMPDLESFNLVLNQQGKGIDHDDLETALGKIKKNTLSRVAIFGTYHASEHHVHFLSVLDEILSKRQNDCDVILISSLDQSTIANYLRNGICTDISSRHPNFFALSHNCPRFFMASTSDPNLDNLTQLTE